MSTIDERLAAVAAQVAQMKWADYALCAEADPESWFPEKRGSGTIAAKRICGQCFVREQCLEWALDHAETWGIWGGLSERERRRVRRDREQERAA